MKKWILILLGCIANYSDVTFANCQLYNSQNQIIDFLNDAISYTLRDNQQCASDVFIFRDQLKQAGLLLEPTMVANRGYHNPREGSFSLFEIVSGQQKDHSNIEKGDFFFGHFTAVDDNNQLIADQNPDKNSLMIEAFAWDEQKGLYNFYELRGDGEKGQWYYRGDSSDIFTDNTLLHRQIDSEHPQFGNNLRCSACHSQGAAIIKELDEPHNDWWNPTRQLDLGGRKPDTTLKTIMDQLVPAEKLKESVIQSLKKLNNHSNFRSSQNERTWQEQLRPLFCPMEVNLASDISSNDENKETIAVPVDFFVDSRLISPDKRNPIMISRHNYVLALQKANSRFPETLYKDADHAWLTPVKATSDKIAIDALVNEQLISEKFITDVLSIDMTNPIFSSARCHLLRYVPNSRSVNWQKEMIQNLKQANEPMALDLANMLSNDAITALTHQEQANKFVAACHEKAKDMTYVNQLYHLLLQRRTEIKDSEISKNPRGQILEPGFRVIFPETSVKSKPEALSLSDKCDIISH